MPCRSHRPAGRGHRGLVRVRALFARRLAERGHAPLVLTGRDAARLDAAREPSAPPRVSSAAQYAAEQIASVRFKSQLDLE